MIEDIDAVIREGLTVYDAGGEKIGVLKEYSPTAAYLVVQTGLLAHKDLYVPYSAIRSIDPHDVFLTMDKAALLRDHSAPPPATVLVEGETARTLVPGGYDGKPAEFNSVNVEMVRRQLLKGMTVYKHSGEKIGHVDGIDEAAGFMLVHKGLFSDRDFVIPFSAVETIDGERNEVRLAVSRDVVQKDFAQMPRDAVLKVEVMAVPGTTPAVAAAVVDDQPALEHFVEEERRDV
jgi:ribosomal 30S subunit maturation factor RimM